MNASEAEQVKEIIDRELAAERRFNEGMREADKRTLEDYKISVERALELKESNQGRQASMIVAILSLLISIGTALVLAYRHA